MKKQGVLKGFSAMLMARFVGAVTVVSAHASMSIGDGTVQSLNEGVSLNEFTDFFVQYKAFAAAITGICALTSLVALALSIAKFSASGGNDMARRKAITGILASGASLAIFGGATVVVGVFWQLFTPIPTVP